MMRRIIIILFMSLVLSSTLPILAQDTDCTLTAEAYREQGITQFNANDIEGAIASYTCVAELDPSDVVTFNNLGYFYGLMGDAESSLKNFALAEKLDPTYPLIFTNRGGLYTNMGQYNEAIADFETAFALSPEVLNPYTYNDWGIALYFLGEYSEAIIKYDRAIELVPDYVEAFNNRGFAYSSLEKQKLAIADFETALELNPDYVNSYLGLGDAYYLLGQAQPALDAYQNYSERVNEPAERAVQRIPELEGYISEDKTEIECPENDLDGYLGAGSIALQNGNMDVAQTMYTCAVQNYPDSAMAYNNRGYLNLESGATELAISDLNKAIEIDPEFAMAYFNRGRAYYILLDLDPAIADLERSIELDNSSSNNAYATLGFLYTVVPDFEAALPYLITASNSFTGNPEALVNVAYSYYQLERYDEAFLAFEQLAVAINRDNFPANIEALVLEVEEITGKTVISSMLACDMITTGGTSSMAQQFKGDGNQALADGDFEEAVQQYQCAIEFNPFDSFAYNNLGLAYYQMGEIELAMGNYVKSLELNPWEAKTYSNRGYLYIAEGDFDLALVDFDTAIIYNPEHINAHFGRADLLVKMGYYEDAKSDLDIVVELLDGDIPAMVADLMDEIESNLSD